MTSENTNTPPLVAGTLQFRDQTAEPRTWTVWHSTDHFQTVDPGVMWTTITTDDGRSAVKKWVPAELASRLPGACDALENEARAGVRIAERYGGNHPAELIELVGYDLDGAEPFVLVDLPRADPVGNAGWLSLDDRHRFQESLWRAILLLSESGVVHGDLSVRNVRWNGTHVRIGDFGHATVVDDVRTPRPDLGTGPPEQRQGKGLVTAKDDVWAAGAVLLHIATGQAGPPDLTNRGAALRTLLDGVFADSVAARPSPGTILRRMNANSAVPPVDSRSLQAVAEGERAFDRALADKKPRPPRVQVQPRPAAKPRPPVRQSSQPARHPRPLPIIGLVFVVIVLGALLVILFFVITGGF